MNISGLTGTKRVLYLSFLTILVLLLYGSHEGLSQNVMQKPSGQSAMAAFSDSNYELAYSKFLELSLLYPKDPLYKYYPGVCLVMLKKDPEKSAALLTEARNQADVMRSIPVDALFYLGRAQQMSGRYTEAIESFKLFTQQAGKKSARDLKVSDFISQCYDKKGLIPGSVITKEPEKDLAPALSVAALATTVPETAEKAEHKGPHAEPLPPDFDRTLTEALVYQMKADSLAKEAARMKSRIEKLPYSEKASARARLSEIEAQEAHYLELADQKPLKKDLPVRDHADAGPVYPGGKYHNEQNQQVIENKKNVPVTSSVKAGEVPDPSAPEEGSSLSYPPVQKTDIQGKNDSLKMSPAKKIPVAGIKNQTGVFSVFEVDPKPVFKAGEMAPVDPETPSGLVYRIQVAVFRNPVAVTYFKGISPAYGYKIRGTDKTTYYVGMFRRSSDAHKALEAVKKKGFKDAFVVAGMDGKPVSAERAAILEKEWGKKSFTSTADIIASAVADTVPPVLTFRVEIKRAPKPLRDNEVEEMKKIAGTRGFDILETENKQTIYLIGKFITFESASDYADLLVRNGYPDAKVTAWLGKKEIPVDTARQLFEKL